MKKDKIVTIRVSEKEKKKLIEKSEVVSELRRIGNNINQLTYLANSGRIYNVDFGEVKQEIGKIWNVINELQNKW